MTEAEITATVDAAGRILENADSELFTVGRKIDQIKAHIIAVHCAYVRVRGERDEARALARDYYASIEALAGYHHWQENWAGDVAGHPWLKEDDAGRKG